MSKITTSQLRSALNSQEQDRLYTNEDLDSGEKMMVDGHIDLVKMADYLDPKLPAGLLKTHVAGFIRPEQMSDELIVNGAILSAQALISLLKQVTMPDPTIWYRYERQGDNIIVSCKREE